MQYAASITKMKHVAALVDRLTIAKIVSLWITTVIGFSIVYFMLTIATSGILYQGQPLARNMAGFGNSMYFSFITATTIGYGEITPIGITKAIAVIEAIFSIAIFGLFITKLVSTTQEEIIEEIKELGIEEASHNTITELYLFRSQLKEIQDTLDKKNAKTKASKEYEDAIENLGLSLRSLNNNKIIVKNLETSEDKQKSLMRLSLIINSIDYSLSKQLELLEQFNKHKIVCQKESTTSALEEIQKVIKTIYSEYIAIKTDDGLSKKVEEKLKDLDKTLTALKKSI